MLDTCKRAAHLTLVALALGTAAIPALAQDADKALEERMAKEKADRKGCKVQICDAARNKKAEGADISCDVVKTWPAAHLKESILKGRMDWPWGNAQCKLAIKLERKVVAKLLSGEDVEAKLEKHPIDCTLDPKEGADKYSIAFAVQPTIKFSKGVATKASLNWSDIKGTAVAQGAVWSAAKLDNNLGLLESVVVDSVNGFFAGQCDEVKDELGK